MDWTDPLQVQAFAIGYMKISRDDFRSFTPIEFDQTCRLWSERRISDTDALNGILRWHAFMTLQPHVKKGSITDPKKLFKLHRESEINKIDEDATKELLKSLGWIE